MKSRKCLQDRSRREGGRGQPRVCSVSNGSKMKFHNLRRVDLFTSSRATAWPLGNANASRCFRFVKPRGFVSAGPGLQQLTLRIARGYGCQVSLRTQRSPNSPTVSTAPSYSGQYEDMQPRNKYLQRFPAVLSAPDAGSDPRDNEQYSNSVDACDRPSHNTPLEVGSIRCEVTVVGTYAGYIR